LQPQRLSFIPEPAAKMGLLPFSLIRFAARTMSGSSSSRTSIWRWFQLTPAVAEMHVDGSGSSALRFVLTTASLNAAGMAPGADTVAIGGSPLVRLTGGIVAGVGLGISAGLV
jgi:urease accessory protein